MKQRNQLLLALVLCLGLLAAACGGSTAEVTDQVTEAAGEVPETEVEQTEEEAAEEPAGEEEVVEEEAAPEPISEAAADSIYAGDFVDLDGQSIDLASFEGQDVVLWFWAPW